MQLVSAEEILAFLPNERNTPDTLQNPFLSPPNG